VVRSQTPPPPFDPRPRRLQRPPRAEAHRRPGLRRPRIRRGLQRPGRTSQRQPHGRWQCGAARPDTRPEPGDPYFAQEPFRPYAQEVTATRARCGSVSSPTPGADALVGTVPGASDDVRQRLLRLVLALRDRPRRQVWPAAEIVRQKW